MKENNTKPFGLKDKLGYMFGDLGNNFTFILSSTMLMKFYSDIMGVSVGLIGTMMMLARFVDAFTDITMGQIVDRSRPGKSGKFLPWITVLCGPVAVSSFLMYAVWFKSMPMNFKIFWMFFSYLLWGSVFYTGINIPYGSMACAISEKPNHRAELSNWRTIGSSLASMVISVALPLYVYYTDEQGNHVLSGTRTTIAALVCSILAVICFLLCRYLVTERVHMETKVEKISPGRLLKNLLTNKSLIGIVIASICMLLVQLTSTTMSTYVFPNYFKNTAAQSAIGIISVVITLICAGFTVKLSKRFGRKELGIASAVFGAVIYFITFIIQTTNAWLFVAIYGISYIGMAIFSLISWAMITDVIDDTEVITGTRADGTIYSVYSFARKLGQAAASGISGFFLTLIGYSTETAFEPYVTKGIYNITCLVPAIGYILLALVLIFLYPLNKRKVEANAKLLSEKRKK